MKKQLVTMLAAVLALSGLGVSADVLSIDPSVGSPGSEVVITTTDLGGGKPKVYLWPSNPVGKVKKIGLKVVEYGDTSIRASLKKGISGVYDVVVLVKGMPEQTLASAFEIAGPEIASVSPDSGAPNDQITVFGQHFGAKVKAMIGSSRAKVVAADDTHVDLLIPKKLSSGVYDVIIMNKVGVATGTALVTVTGSPASLPKKDFMEGLFGGDSFSLKAGPSLTATWSRTTKLLIVAGVITPRGLGGTIKQVLLTGIIDLEGSLPDVIDETPGNPNQGFLSYQKSVLPDHIGGVPIVSAWQSKDNIVEWAIVVDAFDGARLAGRFYGVIHDVNTNAPLLVEDGEFAVSVLVQ